MAGLTLYQCRPKTGFHFGEEGLELEESRVSFPSDSLFAALVATVAEQEGPDAAAAFVAPFLGDEPPFRLTSVFPYVGRLPLLPLPHLRLHTVTQLPRKFAKKVRYVSPGIFQALAQGEAMDPYLEGSPAGRFLQEGAVWLTAGEVEQLPAAWLTPPPGTKGNLAEQQARLRQPDRLNLRRVWQQGSVPRVTLDRATSASTIYLMGRVAFNENCGLWLGVAYQEASWRSRLEELLRHLGDRGIGGERSNGYGGFSLLGEPDLASPLPPDSPGSDAWLLLSRFHPRPGEVRLLQDGRAAYQLVTVGGWLTSPAHQHLRRKRVNLVAEGSVLAGDVRGDLVDVRPAWTDFSHPVYRYGLALTVPVRQKAGAE
jgi:CRISPR-associated protein Csm4